MAAAACAGTPPTTPSRESADDSRQQFGTPHFVFHHAPADSARVPAIASAVEAHYFRVISDLHVGPMPPVHVFFYQSHSDLSAAVRGVVGTIPAWATGLVTAADQIHLLSPGVTGASTPEAFAVTVVHEFTHCVSMAVEPRSANNPRWLWEATALYEANQTVDPARIARLVVGPPPTLNELSSFDDRRIYDVGYAIGEFIVQRWGRAALPELIRNTGNTRAVLGVSQLEFERDLYAALRARYAS